VAKRASGVVNDSRTGLGHGSSSNQNLPGENHGACAFARRRKSPFNDELIETNLCHRWSG